MSDAGPIRQSESVRRNLRQIATFERPPEERPSHDSLEAIAEWLVGPARRHARGLHVFDEFAWRMLAAGLPLLRLTAARCTRNSSGRRLPGGARRPRRSRF